MSQRLERFSTEILCEIEVVVGSVEKTVGIRIIMFV